MRKLLAILLTCVLALGALPALADGQTLTYAYANDLTTLDVSQMNDEMSGLVQYAVNAALVRFENGEMKNELAEKIDVSADGRTYTFTLRDAVWADGQPVTAGDFKYSFLRTLNPDTGSSQVASFDDVVGAIDYYSGTGSADDVKISAPDDKTLVLELVAANPFFIESMARGINYYPIRQDYVEKYGADYGSSPETFIGCGAFTLAEWVKASSLKFVKNPAYWNADTVKLEEVNELIISDANTAIGLYDNGDVDALYSISDDYVPLYPEAQFLMSDSIQYLCYMCDEKSVMSNENLRLALSYAIDRQAVAEAVCAHGTQVAQRMIVDSYQINNESIAENYPGYAGIPQSGDLEKAKEYLAKAMEELGVAKPEDLPEIRYVAMESTKHQLMATALQAQWKQNLGVEVKLDVRPVMQAIVGGLLSGDFDIYLVSVSIDINPATNLSNYIFDGGDNYAKWNNEEYTALIKAAQFEEDLPTRFTKLAQAEEIILSAAAITPLWVPGGAYVTHEHVKNLTYGPWTGSMEFIHAYIE